MQEWMGSRSKGSRLLAAAGRRAAGENGLDEALEALGQAAVEVTGADAVAIRVVDEDGTLGVRTVISRSEALASELAGSSFPVDELPDGELSPERFPEAVRRAARLIGADGVLLLPAGGGGRPLGSIELLRATREFEPGEVVGAQLAAAHIGLVLRAFGLGNGAGSSPITPEATLSLAGDALAAGLDRARSAEEVVGVAARASGAEAALLWSPGEDGALGASRRDRPRRCAGRRPLAGGFRTRRARTGPAGGADRRVAANGCDARPRSAAARRAAAGVRARSLSLASASWSGSARSPFARRRRFARASGRGRRHSSSSTPRPCSPSSARRSPSSRWRTRCRRRSLGSPNCSAPTGLRCTSATGVGCEPRPAATSRVRS